MFERGTGGSKIVPTWPFCAGHTVRRGNIRVFRKLLSGRHLRLWALRERVWNPVWIPILRGRSNTPEVRRHSRKFHTHLATTFWVALYETQDMTFDFSLGSSMDQTQSLSNFNWHRESEESAVRPYIHSLTITKDRCLS